MDFSKVIFNRLTDKNKAGVVGNQAEKKELSFN